MNPRVLEFAPWSASKAKMALNCPFQFHAKYVEKHEGTAPPIAQKRQVGLAAHKVLELALKNGGDPDLDALFTQGAQAYKLTHAEVTDLQSYRAALARFITRTRDFQTRHMAPAQSPLVELRMAMTPGFTPCKFFDNSGLYRGVMDLGLPTQGGTLVVIDHKARPRGRMVWYEDQLKGYQVLGTFGLYLKDYEVRAVQPAVHYMLDGVVDFMPPMGRAQAEKRGRLWLTRTLEAASRSVEENPTLQKTGKHCEWCEYTTLCETYQARSNGAKRDTGEGF